MPLGSEMHLAIARLVPCLALLCGACGAPQVTLSTGGSPSWSDPPYRSERDVWLAQPWYGRGGWHDPAVACDSFGRCWHVGSDRFRRGYSERRDADPPAWADNLPQSARTQHRFLRPGSDVVCDRATRICYKQGEVDKSDTQRVFGERAGDRADALRDRFGTARLFAPERGVACDRENRMCLEDGDPDRSLTRRFFGRRAARALDDEPPREDDARRPKRRPKRKEG
jgi:Fels-1 Prophage Protein-like